MENIAHPDARHSGFAGYKRKAIVLGRFVFTTVENAQGAPFIDRCGGTTEEGRSYSGYAIQFNPFRFNRYGDREIGNCLVLGWIRS